MSKPIKISVVIPYFESDLDKRRVLQEAVDSLDTYDELIIVNDIKSRGPTRAVIQGFAIAHGDYIICMTDDLKQLGGSLVDLCIPGVVTSPKINETVKGDELWGMMFCIPRPIYEQVGVLDPIYDGGLYYDDEDLVRTLRANGIPMQGIDSVSFSHPEGGRSLRDNPRVKEMLDRNRKLFGEKWGSIA